MSRRNIRTLLIAAVVLAGATHTDALPRYEVKNSLNEAGAIVGVASLGESSARGPRTLEIKTNEKHCLKHPIPDESLVVSKDGHVRWAVVSIRKIAAGKAFPKAPTVLDQKGCRFIPHVVVVPVKQELVVRNSDGILHNVHVVAKRNRSSNIAMSGSRKEMKMKFRRAERMRVKCDAHPWMGAWIIAAGHPYYAVTGADGGFRLDKVPPGTYRVEAWHETLGTVEREVKVVAGKETRLDFVFKG